MSKKVSIEIDLDLETARYDVRFKKLSKEEDFEMNYWELRALIDKVLLSLDYKIETQGSDKTFKMFMIN